MAKPVKKEVLVCSKSKSKSSFSDYLEKFYSNKPLRTDKKQRVIVSKGRVIF